MGNSIIEKGREGPRKKGKWRWKINGQWNLLNFCNKCHLRFDPFEDVGKGEKKRNEKWVWDKDRERSLGSKQRNIIFLYKVDG